MLLCRVQGNVVATRKHPSLEGWRLAVCQPVGSTGAPEGSPQVAIDPLGADTGEYVMISSDGLATRRLVGDDRSPARWIVIGIIDAIDLVDEANERRRVSSRERSGATGAAASERVGGSAGAKPPGQSR